MAASRAVPIDFVIVSSKMIRPASEIEFPPSEALCTKARMIARMESLMCGSENMVSTIAERFGSINAEQAAELDAFSAEQKRLLENMKRIIRS